MSFLRVLRGTGTLASSIQSEFSLGSGFRAEPKKKAKTKTKSKDSKKKKPVDLNAIFPDLELSSLTKSKLPPWLGKFCRTRFDRLTPDWYENLDWIKRTLKLRRKISIQTSNNSSAKRPKRDLELGTEQLFEEYKTEFDAYTPPYDPSNPLTFPERLPRRTGYLLGDLNSSYATPAHNPFTGIKKE
eukprot:TRINITY_DN6117_c0_g1_i1.p1 TRINITY_DN6117_c0_g1~~TRINITY_DN6117_c0_g1_i1.p1  ORF type:complete len:193 (-),score=39.70 TRINITY_DN6117_c0_g1_i1:68-625(-)